jgi:hypothetical protein
MGSLVRIGKAVYPPRYYNPTPPVRHFQKVLLYTFRGSLCPEDLVKFDYLSANKELGLQFIGEFENEVFREDFCRMLKVAHRLRRFY